jgi:hypothetical protein
MILRLSWLNAVRVDLLRLSTSEILLIGVEWRLGFFAQTIKSCVDYVGNEQRCDDRLKWTIC